MIEYSTVEGLAELEAALVALGDEVAMRGLRKAGRESMAPVKLAVQAGAGYDPTSDGPHMHDEIRLYSKKLPGGNAAMVVRVGAMKRHSLKAIAQEYGTAKQEPAPFLRPALYENQQQVLGIFTSVLTREIRRALLKLAPRGGRR